MKKISFFSVSLRSCRPCTSVSSRAAIETARTPPSETQRQSVAHGMAVAESSTQTATYGRRYRPRSAAGWLISKLTSTSSSFFQGFDGFGFLSAFFGSFSAVFDAGVFWLLALGSSSGDDSRGAADGFARAASRRCA